MTGEKMWKRWEIVKKINWEKKKWEKNDKKFSFVFILRSTVCEISLQEFRNFYVDIKLNLVWHEVISWDELTTL